MEKKTKKSRLAGIPAWALSLMTFFVSVGLFGLPLPESVDTIIGLIIYIILLPTACLIICKTHPKSVWYTPLICNAFIIYLLISVSFSYHPDLTLLIFLSGCIVLSVIGSFIGAKIGRRLINQSK